VNINRVTVDDFLARDLLILGPPVGYLPEELTQDEAWAKAVAEEFDAN